MSRHVGTAGTGSWRRVILLAGVGLLLSACKGDGLEMLGRRCRGAEESLLLACADRGE